MRWGPGGADCLGGCGAGGALLIDSAGASGLAWEPSCGPGAAAASGGVNIAPAHEDITRCTARGPTLRRGWGGQQPRSEPPSLAMVCKSQAATPLVSGVQKQEGLGLRAVLGWWEFRQVCQSQHGERSELLGNGEPTQPTPLCWGSLRLCPRPWWEVAVPVH